MATVSLTILYCLNLLLSNGLIKHFVLQFDKTFEGSRYYYTPANCTSENDFWLRHANDTTANERSSSRVDFRHREFLATNVSNEWSIMIFNLFSGVKVQLNGKGINPYENVGLNEGDKIILKYRDMAEPMNFEYGKCSHKIDPVPTGGVTVTTTTMDQTELTNKTVATTTQLKLTANEMNRTESTTSDPLQNKIMLIHSDLEDLDERVKVTDEEMEGLKLQMKQIRKVQTDKGTSSTSGLLVGFTIVSVLALSIVLAFNIYHSKKQKKQIETLTIEVNRYRCEIQEEN